MRTGLERSGSMAGCAGRATLSDILDPHEIKLVGNRTRLVSFLREEGYLGASTKAVAGVCEHLDVVVGV